MKEMVFFTRFPNAEEERDGFYQRVLAIDALFSDRMRTYVRFDPAPRRFPTRRRIDERRTEVTLNPFRLVHAVYLLGIVLRARVVYAHSILNLSNRLSRLLFGLPFVKSILDLHGVVPEEFEMYGNTVESAAHGRYEAEVVQSARAIVVVTHAMGAHLREKYPSIRAQLITLPVFHLPRGIAAATGPRPAEPLTIIYAGGTQRWQRIPEMFDAIARSPVNARYHILVPEPDSLRDELTRLPAGHEVRVASAGHEEVLRHYRAATFGFALRADSVVNRVACPTKLIEYLAYGVIPILDSAQIGDFVEYGMKFLAVSDFVAGKVPDLEAAGSIGRANQAVLARLQDACVRGSQELKSYLGLE